MATYFEFRFWSRSRHATRLQFFTHFNQFRNGAENERTRKYHQTICNSETWWYKNFYMVRSSNLIQIRFKQTGTNSFHPPRRYKIYFYSFWSDYKILVWWQLKQHSYKSNVWPTPLPVVDVISMNCNLRNNNLLKLIVKWQ